MRVLRFQFHIVQNVIEFRQAIIISFCIAVRVETNCCSNFEERIEFEQQPINSIIHFDCSSEMAFCWISNEFSKACMFSGRYQLNSSWSFLFNCNGSHFHVVSAIETITTAPKYILKDKSNVYFKPYGRLTSYVTTNIERKFGFSL